MYFVMCVISFLLGSFRIIGRVYEYFIFSKNKFGYAGNKDVYITLFLNLLIPYSVCSYIFSSVDVNITVFLLILIACFSVGYSLSDTFFPLIDDLIRKNSPFLNQTNNDSEEIESIKSNNGFFQPIKNIYWSFFKKKYILRHLNCQLCEENHHYRKKFDKLCASAGLEEIELFLFEASDIGPAFALYNPFYIREKHSIFLNSYWCSRFTPSEITALMGHELMHINNKDGGLLSKFRPIFFIGLLLSSYMLIGYLGTFIAKSIPIIEIIFMIIYAFLAIPVLFFMIYLMLDIHGFWEQLREIKADRYSCEIEGVTREGLVALLKKLKRFDDNDLRRQKWYDKIILRYKVRPTHPNLKYRIELIEKYKKWSIRDYFLLILNTVKWAITGKGWSGR